MHGIMHLACCQNGTPVGRGSFGIGDWRVPIIRIFPGCRECIWHGCPAESRILWALQSRSQLPKLLACMITAYKRPSTELNTTNHV